MINHSYTSHALDEDRTSDGIEGLTDFVFHYLVNRTDTYATYPTETEVHERHRRIVNELLTKEVIKRSLFAVDQSDLIAVPTRSLEDSSRFLMIEIYQQPSGDDPLGKPAESAASAIYWRLVHTGFIGVILRFKYEIRLQVFVVFGEPVPADQLHRFGEAIVDSCDNPESGICVDVHPKQQSRTEDFVLLPCLNPDNIACSEFWDPYDSYGDEWNYANRYSIPLNHSESIASGNFVLNPVMTVEEFNAKPHTASERPIDRVLSRLKGVQRSGQGYKGCCPGHVDFHRSLLISEDKDGNALLYCCRGCTHERILSALDPSARDVLRGINRVGYREMQSARSRKWDDYRTAIEFIAAYIAYRPHTTQEQVDNFAAALQVSPESLEDLEVACDQNGSGGFFPVRDASGSLDGIQSFLDLPHAISQAKPKSSDSVGGHGLIIPKSFDVKKPEIIIVNGAINAAVGLTLGWNVIGCDQEREHVAEAIRLLENAKGEIRVLQGYSPIVEAEVSKDLDRLQHWEDDDYFLDEARKQELAYPSMNKCFVDLLQRGLKARVSIMEVPREFKEIRMAAYQKSRSE